MIQLFRFSPSRLALSYIGLSVLVLALFAIPLWHAWSVNISTFKEYVHSEDVERMVNIFEGESTTTLAAAIDTQASNFQRDQTDVYVVPSILRIACTLPTLQAEFHESPGTYSL